MNDGKSMEVAQGLEGNRYTYWVLCFVDHISIYSIKKKPT
jgi:hypothetical protein